MRPNCNPRTGIPYGVLSANRFPYLYDDITSNGVDETYEAQVRELRESLVDLFADFDADEVPPGEPQERIDAVVDMTKKELSRRLHMNSREAAVLADCFIELLDTDSMTFDIEEVVDACMDAVDGEYFADSGEHEYTYVDGPVRYRLGYLGGAALIWVIESPFVTYCRSCSPCVAGGGDLNTTRAPDDANSIAYCPPPEDFCQEESQANWPVGIWRVDEEGNVGEQIWANPDATES